ncbi:MAG: TIGR01777 family oxidoreductase [Mycobacteriaceae bacterium]
MRIVVAGSSGLIGTALVAALRSHDHEVLRLVRRAPAAPDERRWNPARGDIANGALDGVDAVVNLCGVGIGDKRWTGARKQAIRDSRLEPTDVLARAVVAHDVPTLVNASAVGYYGDTGARSVDEDAGVGQGFLSEVCRDWEAATAPASDAGVRVALLRTGLVLSASGGLLGRLAPLYKLALGGRLGDGRQYYPWVSLTDEVEAIRFVLETPAVNGPVNVTGPEPVTNAAFNKAMGEAFHRPAPWVVPGFALKLAIGEFAEEGILTGQRAVPAKLVEHGYTFTHATLADALHAVTGS